MSEMAIKKRCWVCAGDGIYQGLPCLNCNGEGKVEKGEGAETVNTTEITDKLNDIFTEQAAQRADLTMILTKIWNKVNE